LQEFKPKILENNSMGIKTKNHEHNNTHTQSTKNKVSGCTTLLPVAPLPPLFMATSAMDPNLGIAATNGTMHGVRHQVCSCWGWFSCLGHREDDQLRN
jgi:hypothetical protein